MKELPQELQLYIFSFLAPKDLAVLNRVDKASYGISNDDSLWKIYLKKDFGYLTIPKEYTAKKYYQHLLKTVLPDERKMIIAYYKFQCYMGLYAEEQNEFHTILQSLDETPQTFFNDAEVLFSAVDPSDQTQLSEAEKEMTDVLDALLLRPETVDEIIKVKKWLNHPLELLFQCHADATLRQICQKTPHFINKLVKILCEDLSHVFYDDKPKQKIFDRISCVLDLNIDVNCKSSDPSCLESPKAIVKDYLEKIQLMKIVESADADTAVDIVNEMQNIINQERTRSESIRVYNFDILFEGLSQASKEEIGIAIQRSEMNEIKQIIARIMERPEVQLLSDDTPKEQDIFERLVTSSFRR